MKTYALVLAITLFAVLNLWVYYVAMMRLQMVQRQGKITAAMKWFAYPALVVGLGLDFVINILLLSLLFLELPRERTVSARLYRLSTQDFSDWRQSIALALRVGLLDEIDPDGIHKG